MTALASSPPAITASVRQQLLVSLVADFCDATIEELNPTEIRDLLHQIGSPHMSRHMAAKLPTFTAGQLKVLLYRVRQSCRLQFEPYSVEN